MAGALARFIRAQQHATPVLRAELEKSMHSPHLTRTIYMHACVQADGEADDSGLSMLFEQIRAAEVAVCSVVVLVLCMILCMDSCVFASQYLSVGWPLRTSRMRAGVVPLSS